MKVSIKFLLLASAISAITGSLGFVLFPKIFWSSFYAAGIPLAIYILEEKIDYHLGKKQLTLLITAATLPILYLGIPSWKMWSLRIDSIPAGIIGLVFMSAFIFISAFLEEVGWRNFLFSKLSHLKKIHRDLFIGTAWAIWHYPVIFTAFYFLEGSLIPAVIIFTINVILLHFVLAWFRERSGGILATIILHASHNIVYLCSLAIPESSWLLSISLGITVLLTVGIKNHHNGNIA